MLVEASQGAVGLSLIGTDSLLYQYLDLIQIELTFNNQISGPTEWSQDHGGMIFATQILILLNFSFFISKISIFLCSCVNGMLRHH